MRGEKKKIYLDNSTLAKPSERAIGKMIAFFTDQWGSLSSPHQMGQELYPAVEESYKAIYSLFDAKNEDGFVLTSSGAEAVNQVMFSAYYDLYLTTGKNHVITSVIDEAPAVMSANRLEKMGCVAKSASVDSNGRTTAASIADLMTPRTSFVSLSWANGLTGVIHPVQEISDLCKERGVRFHLDATHVLGKLFFNRDDIGADFVTFNGSQIHAPKGCGGIYIKEGTKLSPLIVGGTDQEGKRAGCLNVPSLVALGCAAQEALEQRDLLCTEVARLRNRLEQGISAGFSEAFPFFKDQERLPHCTAIAFPGIANEAMLFSLNRKGVFASIGGGNFQQLGLMLAASGISEPLAHSAVSFSLSRETYEEEVDRAIDIIVDTAKKLRKLSAHLVK